MSCKYRHESFCGLPPLAVAAKLCQASNVFLCPSSDAVRVPDAHSCLNQGALQSQAFHSISDAASTPAIFTWMNQCMPLCVGSLPSNSHLKALCMLFLTSHSKISVGMLSCKRLNCSGTVSAVLLNFVISKFACASLQVLMDEYCVPHNPITDYNTRYSGISAETLQDVTKRLADVQQIFLTHVTAETLLVGHGLENDLAALKIMHARNIDTSIIYPHPKVQPVSPPSTHPAAHPSPGFTCQLCQLARRTLVASGTFQLDDTIIDRSEFTICRRLLLLFLCC